MYPMVKYLEDGHWVPNVKYIEAESDTGSEIVTLSPGSIVQL